MDTVTISYYEFHPLENVLLDKKIYSYPNVPRLPLINSTLVIKDMEYKVIKVKYNENLNLDETKVNNTDVNIYLEKVINIWDTNI